MKLQFHLLERKGRSRSVNLDVQTQPRSKALFERARQLTPGGVHSNVRLNAPRIFIERAKGSWMWSADGDDYVDYLLGQGPNLLGHAPDVVLDAVDHACRNGLIYASGHELEIRAAEAVLGALGWADMVRFGVSGTESVQAALRLARATTGRRKVIRFEGHYHGWLDNVLIAQREGRWGAASEGQLASHLVDFLILPWNDATAVEHALLREGSDVAAIIMEPIMINAGVIPPAPGYLSAVRRLCDDHGVVLIFDEIIAGFRLGLGGAASHFGVTPDLATYGKAMAGGWPVSALAGRAELMMAFGDGRVNHSGTFNSSVMAMAATIATLEVLANDPPYQRIDTHGTELMKAIAGLGPKYDVPLHVQGLPVAFHVSFGEVDATDYRTLRGLDLARYERFAETLINHRVWVSGRGVWYVSAAHGDHELDAALTRFEAALVDSLSDNARTK